MVNVGIVGATGYTGLELLRLLVTHPNVDSLLLTSRKNKGLSVGRVYPEFQSVIDLEYSEPSPEVLADCDVVFFCTPHGVAQTMVPSLLEVGVKVIDLSADFRIRDVSMWEKWYGMTHGAPNCVARAVYGLPEFNREKIALADLIACPGCYPTTVELGLLPLLENGCLELSDIIANVASGVSGAGKTLSTDKLFAEVNDSFKAYGVSGHRHQPEIEQILSEMAGNEVNITFVPHLLPINRGIHSTLYGNLKDSRENVQGLFEDFYRFEPFVQVLPAGLHPSTRNVRGTNICQISVCQPGNNARIIVLVVEDNLTKGASGQAIQCMNIMFSFSETDGLSAAALVP
ncbi:MAG: N-acetyl-gamma-glutamyl-phosphate reductase [Cellvibrionales bacterium TMED148]|nr:N-acetyl-gamma-glutamyl-phosphate reductase [Porticoccaceae bacterium]RPG88681.1 MAG: N-acetyl-gamma-glutamyl-phosphate reductase [Cellvibrionales bacterium TMED148]